jgi:hypothetical protein
MFDRRNLRHRANQLLVLAQKARDDDYIKLAEYITDRATQLFGEAIVQERQSIQAAANSLPIEMGKAASIARPDSGPPAAEATPVITVAADKRGEHRSRPMKKSPGASSRG